MDPDDTVLDPAKDQPPIRAPVKTLLDSNPSDRALITFHNIFVSVKLGSSNFIIWRHQILKILRSLELKDYVLIDSPPKHKDDGTI